MEIANVETPRPSPFSLMGSFVFSLSAARKTQRGLCVKHDQPSHIWNAPTICLHQVAGGGPTDPGNVPRATRACHRLCPGSCTELSTAAATVSLHSADGGVSTDSRHILLLLLLPRLVWIRDVTPDHSGIWLPGSSYTGTHSPPLHPFPSSSWAWAWACPHLTAKWPVWMMSSALLSVSCFCLIVCLPGSFHWFVQGRVIWKVQS